MKQNESLEAIPDVVEQTREEESVFVREEQEFEQYQNSMFVNKNQILANMQLVLPPQEKCSYERFRNYMLKDYMPGVPMKDWLNMRSLRKMVYVSKYFGSNCFKRGVVHMRNPKMTEEDQIYLLKSKNLKQLFTRVIELSEKHDSGQIIADKNQTWRTAFAYVSTLQSLSNLNRKL